MQKRRIIYICAIAILIVLTVMLSSKIYKNEKRNEDISFSFNDTLPDGEGRIATVILLGGQSNASGCSRDDYLKKYVSAEKYEQYQNGFDNVYINYVSGTKTSNGFVKCGSLQGELDGCFGPELGIADKLNEMYPDETFYIIKCAWGGSNLCAQWLSPSSRGRTGDLYKYFVAFVKANIDYLVSKNYRVRIEGMCWMQGESDSIETRVAQSYEMRLSNFITDIRKEFREHSSYNGIAFVDAYIANTPEYWRYYELINKSKDTVAASSPMNTVIDTVAHGLTCSKEPLEAPDLAHYDSMSGLKLGHLFAEEIAKFFD